MNYLAQTVKELISCTSEEEWFEFKESWYDANGIGEYISALSNTAAMLGKEQAYLIWGVSNDTHEIVGTKFDYHQDVKNEPLEHYLARQITPDIVFSFHEVTVNRRPIVVLVIPAAVQIPTHIMGIAIFALVPAR